MRTGREWICWYYRARDSHGAQGLRFVDSMGRLYAKKCGRCRHSTRHSKSDGTPVCGHCGTAWHYDEKFILKGEVQRTMKTDGFELRNARQYDIGRLVGLLLRDHPIEGHLYVSNCMHHSIRQLAELGPKMWSDWDMIWNYRAVREKIQAGAAIWEDALLKAEIPYARF